MGTYTYVQVAAKMRRNGNPSFLTKDGELVPEVKELISKFIKNGYDKPISWWTLNQIGCDTYQITQMSNNQMFRDMFVIRDGKHIRGLHAKEVIMNLDNKIIQNELQERGIEI